MTLALAEIAYKGYLWARHGGWTGGNVILGAKGLIEKLPYKIVIISSFTNS